MRNYAKNLSLIGIGFLIGASVVSFEWMMETIRPKGHRLTPTKKLVSSKKQEAFENLVFAVKAYEDAKIIMDTGEHYNDPTWPYENLSAKRIDLSIAATTYVNSLNG